MSESDPMRFVPVGAVADAPPLGVAGMMLGVIATRVDLHHHGAGVFSVGAHGERRSLRSVVEEFNPSSLADYDDFVGCLPERSQRGWL